MRRLKRIDGTTLAYLLIAAALAAVLAVAWCGGAFAEVLKQSTANQKVILGPFVTSGTGHIISTALTVTVTISKNGGTLAARASTVTPVSVGSGYYAVTLNGTDTDTAGNLEVVGYASGYLRCRAKSQVLVASAWNAMYTSTLLAVNMTQISGDAAAADNLETACDNYSATRGLSGTALPAAAAFAVGGLPDAAAIADAVLDEVIKPPAHNEKNSLAWLVWRIRPYVIEDGTATAITADTMQLAVGSSGEDGFYRNLRAVIIDGEALQVRAAAEYDGGTRTITFARPLTVVPAELPNYVLLPDELSKLASNGLDNVLQDIRDTAKLAPSAGDPAAGSIDALLGAIGEGAADWTPEQKAKILASLETLLRLIQAGR